MYATSAAAYRGLRDYNVNQSILVSGESGAGNNSLLSAVMKQTVVCLLLDTYIISLVVCCVRLTDSLLHDFHH